MYEFVIRAGRVLLPYVSCLTVPDCRIVGISPMMLASTLCLHAEAKDFSSCFFSQKC